MNRKKVQRIAILGPDGSGKSTLIEALKMTRGINYYHLKPRRSSGGPPVVNPHSRAPYNWLLSVIKIFYLVVQYNLLWFKNIYLNPTRNLVVFDRYFDDILCDPVRYRYKGSLRLIRFMRNLMPRPDLYFVLLGEPELIWSRKKEVTLENLKRQLICYEELTKSEKFISVSVDISSESSLKFIISHL